MHHRRLDRWGPVHVRVDQHLVVEAVDRVVQRRRVVTKLDARGPECGREVGGAEPYPGVQLRHHATTLYNSIYRFDDQALINTHVYGAPAVQSPVMHLRRVPGGRLFGHYLESFERVWETATPVAADA